MNQKKNALPGAATPNRAVENRSVCETTQPSTADDTTSAAGGQSGFIADLLSYGSENGVTLRHLEKLTGADNRTIRRQIELERRSGIPILSDCVNGYYLPGSQSERDRCVRSLRSRAKEIEKTADAIERGR